MFPSLNTCPSEKVDLISSIIAWNGTPEDDAGDHISYNKFIESFEAFESPPSTICTQWNSSTLFRAKYLLWIACPTSFLSREFCLKLWISCWSERNLERDFSLQSTMRRSLTSTALKKHSRKMVLWYPARLQVWRHEGALQFTFLSRLCTGIVFFLLSLDKIFSSSGTCFLHLLGHLVACLSSNLLPEFLWLCFTLILCFSGFALPVFFLFVLFGTEAYSIQASL